MTVKELIKLLKQVNQEADMRMVVDRIGAPVRIVEDLGEVVYLRYFTDQKSDIDF